MILSFLPPSQEAVATERWGERVVSARKLAQEVRPEARRLYHDLIVRIAATPLAGRTLRQALQGDGGCSRWWYLKTSEKNTLWDRDPYECLIRLLCVKRVVQRYGAKRLRCFGAGWEFTSILAGTFEVPSGPFRRLLSILYGWWGFARAVLRGGAARAVSCASYLQLLRLLRRRKVRAGQDFDVLLEGHWGLSVQAGMDGRLQDRFFSDLPEALGQRGLRVGWLGWCEPVPFFRRWGRALANLASAAAPHEELILTEGQLTARDVLRVMLNPGYLLKFLRFARLPGFRELFTVEGMDLYDLLRKEIIEQLAGTSVGRWELLEKATQRFCAEWKPKLILIFLHPFLQARAVYAGARLGSPGTKVWEAQHASYCRDKAFGLLDPDRELRGLPDGYPVPAPDGLFLMGDLSRQIWSDNGYPENRLMITGGLRYQHVRLRRAKLGTKRPLVVLLAASMVLRAELELCDAICAASRGLPLRVRLRDHPYCNLSGRRAFAPFRRVVEITTGTAEQDLDGADLVLFTHSGLSEEALVRGLPVWQWLTAGVNTSVFLDLPLIPRFTSVAELRRALENFVESPEAYRPTMDAQAEVVRQCFGPRPEDAASVMAERIVGLLCPKMEAVRE